MEPVSAAIIAAIAAGVTTGVGETATKAVVDAYQALKGLLRGRFGEKSRVAGAIDALEAQPKSEGRRTVFLEEVEASGAVADDEIIAAARTLLERLEKAPAGEQHIQQATGNYIAQADRGGTAQVRVGQPPPTPPR